MNFHSSSRNFKTFAYFFYAIVATIAFWYWHVDEHYQITELASYKLGYTPAENLAWDFHSRMRSGILPLIVYLISKLTLAIGWFHPFIPGAICRVISSLIFIYVYLRLLDYIQIDKSSLLYKIAILFWILPTIMVRFSPESVGCSLFILGFLLIEKSKHEGRYLTYIGIGFIWGLAFYIRMHMAILIATFIIYNLILRSIGIRILSYIFLGFLISSVFELVVNYWVYDALVWSPYYYFIENVIHNKASHFGLMPWYYYFTETLKNLFYPIGALLWLCVGYFTYRYPKHIFTWFFWIFFLMHSFIGHKEYRFLFPIFPFFILMALKSLNVLSQKAYYNNFVKSVWILNIILLPSCILIQTFNPLNWLQLYSVSKQYKTIYTDYPSPYAIDTRFYNVRPYFWKHPLCVIKEYAIADSAEIDNISVYISTKDLGNQIKIGNSLLTKSFQTIPKGVNDRLSISVKNSIDYLYVYKVL